VSVLEVEQFLRSDPGTSRRSHEEKFQSGSAYVNGQYCARKEAMIPISDLGFLHSDVTYEVAAVVHGRFFRLQDHFDRFARSCEGFRLRNPHTREEMLEIFSRLVRLTGFTYCCLLWCVTRGLPRPGADAVRSRNDPDAFENRFYAFVYPYTSIASEDQRRRGLNLKVSERYIRIPARAVDPRAKNFHWMDMKLALFDARDHGFDWAVLTDADGYLTEASGANIFVARNGELYTPETGCLEGITRKTALELAQMIGIRAHVERVHIRELHEADEAFLTSTAGGIMPVNSVDGIVLGGSDGPGELSVRLHNLYFEKMREGWRSTPVDYGRSN
jgi:branched-chain amino acid aminotransferase